MRTFGTAVASKFFFYHRIFSHVFTPRQTYRCKFVSGKAVDTNIHALKKRESKLECDNPRISKNGSKHDWT
jgi:hypothetical protein